MSDMRSPPLLQDRSEAHTRFHTEPSRCAYVPLLQWRECSVIPSWKVIVSAPRGQYSSRALTSPAFFLRVFSRVFLSGSLGNSFFVRDFSHDELCGAALLD